MIENAQIVRLLVRADDMGSSFASNVGCVESCTRGIARSVEVMMPCPWISHAAQLLKSHPGIDLGIHLTLTSEWDAIKWRPLTNAHSLIDAQGYFFPLLSPRGADTRPSLANHKWSIDDIAAEFRAQIAKGLSMFGHVTHVSCHMATHFNDFDQAVGILVAELCNEYNLKDDVIGRSLQLFDGYSKHPIDACYRETTFIQQLSKLSGGDYIFVDHPAIDTAELHATGHPGYEDVHEDRTSCLSVLTSPQVKKAIDDLSIVLIDYKSV